MKKIIVITCIMLTAGVAAMAQLPNFAFGIKGGANYSKLKTEDDLTDENSIVGYHVGIFTRLGAAGLYVQPELYLGSKGNKFIKVEDTNGNEVEASGKVRFTTLDLPLLIGTKIGPSKLNLRFMGGPVASFVINENTTFDSAYQNISDFDNYKKQNWAYQAGAGVDVGNLTIDLRYEGGLSNVSRSDEYNQKQNLFHLSLGIKLL
ncbi:porin family protein [Daejeonella sp.]|uniref:porin family protein n=1 Tax=Daejeonella sp. TaxID=2805397 RepID=UPI0039834584